MVRLFALGVAATTTAYVIGAFHRTPLQRLRGDPMSATLASAGASSIYYRAESNDGASLIGSVASDGTNNHVIFPPDSPTRYAQLAFSPDGNRVAYVDDRPGHRGIYVADADWGNAAQLTVGANDSWPSWSPDGTKIAFVGTGFDPSIQFCNGGEGRLGCPTSIYMTNADGSNITDVTHEGGYSFDPAWSPDGAKIAFAFTPTETAATAIYVVNADGSERAKITSSRGGSDMWPSWSPTGDTIVFGGIHWEDWGVFAVNADGTNERSLLNVNGSYAADPSWSPDGSHIAFGGEVGDAWGIYLMSPDGSDLTRIAGTIDGSFVREIAWGPPMATAHLAGTFDVGLNGSVSGITLGFGSLWVDGYENPTGPGHVIRLDPVTGSQLADVSIGSVAPGWEVGGGGITVGDGAVWVAGTSQVPDGSGVDTQLVRIDPVTNRVVDSIQLGGKLAADVAIDANGVWVMFGGDDDKMRVDRIDPSTDRVAATIPLPEAYGHYLFAFGGSILAFTNETADNVVGNSVVDIIDPMTDSLVRLVPLGAYVWPAAGDSTWASTGTTLERLDASSGDVIGAWPLESTGDALSVGAGGVWSVSPKEGRDAISRWNPVSTTIDLTIDLPSGAGANVIATSTDAAWVLGFGGTITWIQLDSN
ncbi:MAG: hypothetical protein ACRDH7_01540 [Actinomycetota bacterium]